MKSPKKREERLDQHKPVDSKNIINQNLNKKETYGSTNLSPKAEGSVASNHKNKPSCGC